MNITTRTILAAVLTAAALYTADALDLRTTDGTEYKAVTLSRVEPDGLVILTDSGIVKIPFTSLPADVQAQYGHNPKAAADYAAQQAAANKQRLAAQSAELAAVKQRAAAMPNPQDKPATTPTYYPPTTLSKPQERHGSIVGEVIRRTTAGLLVESTGAAGGGGYQRIKGRVIVIGLDAQPGEIIKTAAIFVEKREVSSGGDLLDVWRAMR